MRRLAAAYSITLALLIACLTLLFCVVALAGTQTAAPKGAYLGQTPPGLVPEVFAPGIVSGANSYDYACTFTPDGKEFYFTTRKDGSEQNIIMVTRETEEGWTKPEAVSFSGQYSDHEPYITLDGKKLFFGGSRPLPGGGSTTYRIWAVDRIGDHWGEPYASGVDGMYVSTTVDGTLYTTGLTRYTLKSGEYKNPESLLTSDQTKIRGAHPFIAPDESFVIYDDNMAGDSYGGRFDLYLRLRKPDGTWTPAKNLGAAINTAGSDITAYISPDGEYLFYAAEGEIYWVSTKILGPLKADLKQQYFD